jgi:tetratricopeptide (TPR) repeat protein
LIAGFLVLALSLAQVAFPDASSDAGCASDERAFAKRFSMAVVAMEPESVLGGIYDRATDSERRCPQSEAIAYFRLRAAELGRGGPIVRPAEADSAQLETMATEAYKRFPRSARIATARARILGGLEPAKQALGLDPTYAPAKVALAAAMLASGQATEARDLLEQVPNLGSTSDGLTVLARARLKARDLGGAQKAAQLALRGRNIDLVEPDARDPRPELGAHEILGMISLEKKQYSEAAKHLLIAAQNSADAQSALANANSDFRRAIEKARKRKKPQ